MKVKQYGMVIARFIVVCFLIAGLLTVLTLYGAQQTRTRASGTGYPVMIQTTGFPFAVRTNITATSTSTGNQRSTTIFDKTGLYMNALIWFATAGMVGGMMFVLKAQKS